MPKTATAKQYRDFKRPKWAPPSWVFGPVWTVLYILIAISFGYVGYLFLQGAVGFLVLLPFILNLIFNFAYIFIQFRFRSFIFAAIDVLLVLGTLVWALVEIFPIYSWVSYINIPYLAWVSFASILQITITIMNTRK
jgi:tryptophan-rich sensory protein